MFYSFRWRIHSEVHNVVDEVLDSMDQSFVALAGVRIDINGRQVDHLDRVAL